MPYLTITQEIDSVRVEYDGGNPETRQLVVLAPDKALEVLPVLVIDVHVYAIG